MDEQQNNNLDALDLLSVLMTYINLHNYELNNKQNKKLDEIIFDMEKKLEYQNKMLEKIWEGINKNGR